MTVTYETWIPEHRERILDHDELDRAYERAAGETSPTFTRNDLGDDVVIVAVGDDHAVVSLLTDDTWYYLRDSDADDELEVVLAGEPATVPRGAVVPRDRGLEVLKGAHDVPALLSAYMWVEQ